ncbi:MAG TPA: hypothetical protein VHZ07_23680, partial [Bryobacteraceae bacterium]|nr:hypothetical protein [Bryobacteraceae bacterium]
LRRHFAKDSAELKELVRIREARRKAEMESALNNMRNAKAEGLPFDPREIGFDFSTAELLAFMTPPIAESTSAKLLITPKRSEKQSKNIVVQVVSPCGLSFREKVACELWGEIGIPLA